MFGIFSKKTPLEKLIKSNGYDNAVSEIALEIIKIIKTKQRAYLYILEELDGASQGNYASKVFASNSGISAESYNGALNNSNPEIDGPHGPQQAISRHVLQLGYDPELMAKFRCSVDDKIMAHYGLGKYEARESLTLRDVVTRTAKNPYGQFAELTYDLEVFARNNQSNDRLHIAASEYANLILAGGMFFQGLFKHENYLEIKRVYFEALSKIKVKPSELQEVEHQGLDFVCSHIPNLSNFTALAINRLADSNINFYTLAEKLNMPVNLAPDEDKDEIVFMSIEDCIKIIDISKKISEANTST